MESVEALQLIDENKAFSKDVLSYFDSVNLTSAGLSYHLVSVFGSQSTGKSTLLNALFSTNFDVMNEAARRQTTKGIWMAKATFKDDGTSSPASSDSFLDLAGSTSSNSSRTTIGSTPNVLVLDVEGTDGRERGEDQDFERKSALFALATSEVLIVNMWENQVGLYQGANMGLLKTVFEVNLSLFHSSGKSVPRSVILFVIRDHIGTTPLSNLSQTILGDLEKYWSTISKPEDLKDSQIHDFFDIEFQTLPHKLLMPELFQQQVEQFAARFHHESPDYLFKSEYHRQVPIDGWNLYAEQVWQQIEMNKDLDLPTQQILVARFRCGEISTQASQKFEEDLAAIQAKSPLGGSKVVESFGVMLEEVRTNALHAYDSSASRYNANVYTTQRLSLLSQIDSKITTLIKAQLAALSAAAFDEFANVLENNAKNLKFGKLVVEARNLAEKLFVDGAKEACSIEPEIFTYGKELQEFNAELDKMEQTRKTREINRIAAKCDKRIQQIFNDDLDSYFTNPKDDTWNKVYEFFNSTLNVVLQPYQRNDDEATIDFGVNGTVKDNSKGVDLIRRNAWISLDRKLKEITGVNNVLVILQDQFDALFKYDKHNVPIVWKAGDDIERPYIESRDKTLELLPIFVLAKISNGKLLKPDIDVVEFDDDDDFQDLVANFSKRISETRQQEIISRFKRQADSAYIDAKRSTTQLATQIPLYIIVLLVVLGWNEFMAVLRSPFLFLFCVIMGGAAYITFQLNMWGPMMSVGNAMINRAIVIGKEKLRQSLEVGLQPVSAHPVSTDSSTDPSTSGDLRRTYTMPGSSEFIPMQDLSSTNKEKE